MYDHSEYDDYEELLPGAKKDRRREILDQLQELDSDEYMEQITPSITEPEVPSFLPSSMTKKKKKKHSLPW